MVENIVLYPQHVARLLKIRDKIYTKVATLSCKAALSKEPIKKDMLDKAEFVDYETGMVWGSKFDCAWFKFEGDVPESCKGKHIVALIDIQGEGVVYQDKEVKQGITQVLTGIDILQSRKGKQVVDLFKLAEGGEHVELVVDAGFNGKNRKEGVKVALKKKDIAICNDDILEYYYDYLQLLMVLLTKDKNNLLSESRVKEIKKALNESYALSKKSIDKAHERLAKEIVKPIDYKATEYTAIGHAHIDLAWLWPIRETKRKGVRTFATAINNMNKYPDYIFGASQAQLFQWIKEEEPEFYEEKVKKAVQEDRLEIQGGMWTENDCNIPCGESIIRQFLYGEKFFEDEFGVKCKMVWLPDVFGYPASLPQIFKKCGRDYFMTIKLSWNTRNKFPYKTFIWKGIDGSEVITHMPPQGDYNSTASPMAIVKSEQKNSEKEIVDKALLVYGVGDGGGGPGEAQLEFVKREKSLSGLNVVKQGKAEEFFDDLATNYYEKLPSYQGELYLEKHRGTYTSQARNKYYNRKLEKDLHNIEWLSVIAQVNQIEVDQERIDKIWQEILLYQFHDIIPGSSIKRVYDESVERYKALEKELEQIQLFILSKLATKQKLTAINGTDFDRKEYVKLEDQWYLAEVPKYSAASLLPVGQVEDLAYGDDYISNNKLIVKFNLDGSICSLIDKEHNSKELCSNYLNKLVVFQDPIMHYNAWDIKEDYRKLKKEQFKLINFNSYIDGPEVVRENTYVYNKSTLVQHIKIDNDSKMVTFETYVDWQEDNKMLRAEFEPTIYSDVVNCDIQFGNIDRSTKEDDPVEKAQFEICAHKFVNLDDEKDEYGLALINNCKYGHRVKSGLISLNLLRSPQFPDPTCDRGRQYFSYALYPHDGKWNDSDVVKQSYIFNNPLLISDYMVDIGKLIDIDNEDVIVETIKPAQAEKGIVVRLYERYGSSCDAKLKIGIKAKKVYETNMLEKNKVELSSSTLHFEPYEIKTILIGW